MNNVLVTGGAGFIGSNFVRLLLETRPQVRVVNLDLLTYAGRMENLHDLPGAERHTFVHGDICSRALLAELFARHQIDTVVHFAAETHVDRSIHGPDAFIQTNALGTFHLLEAARLAWFGDGSRPADELRFHHVSTDEVYGSLEPDDAAFTETSLYDPRSPYSASKASSDHFVRAYFHTYGLPVSITNCSNNYGPCQFPEKLIPLMILNALLGKPLPVYGDGRQVRDWLYVSDHCTAILEVIERGCAGETYNVGGGNQPGNIDIVQRICALLDERLPGSPHCPHASLIAHVADRPGHDRRYAMDTTKIQRELGWQPRETLGSGLEKTVDWYLSHPAWVDGLTQGREFQDWLALNYRQRGPQ